MTSRPESGIEVGSGFRMRTKVEAGVRFRDGVRGRGRGRVTKLDWGRVSGWRSGLKLDPNPRSETRL
ncbi:hypothetical protein TIFTF001_017260 [Ficus carica]|uniref:Uncharacterized protein n=1 Tax=Ficus carica TaxID=3494 RepID=A0AA88A4M8_FICCA|nr:hypothetical protein TIFTF001_017260 [Ficus carica]